MSSLMVDFIISLDGYTSAERAHRPHGCGHLPTDVRIRDGVARRCGRRGIFTVLDGPPGVGDWPELT
jgi:hypothetical protein